MSRQKRRRPDINVYYASPAPTSNSQTPPEIVHRHTSFEANASGITCNRITHNHVYVTVPGIVSPDSPPKAAPNATYGMDASNHAMATEDIPDLCNVEDDEEEDDDEYPYNWMDPNFVQGQATAKYTTDKRPKRKPRLATVRFASSHLP